MAGSKSFGTRQGGKAAAAAGPRVAAVPRSTVSTTGRGAARTTLPPDADVSAAVARTAVLRGAFPRYQPWVTVAVRLGLAVVWVWASVPKLTNQVAAAQEVTNYNIFPTGLAIDLGHIQPYVELVLGLLVLLGLGTRIIGVISGLLFLAFIGGIASLWARGIYINCGCFSTANSHFGSATQAGYPAELARDTGFLLLAAWLVVWPRSRFSLDAALLDDAV